MSVEVQHHFTAPIGDVWEMLTDVERMAGLGPEHTAASRTSQARGVGAQFEGTNHRGEMEWTLPCFVTECERPRRFAWAVLELDNPSSVWSYTLRAVDDGTEVVQRFAHGPNYSFIRFWAEEQPDAAATIIENRVKLLREDMSTTLANAERLLVADEIDTAPSHNRLLVPPKIGVPKRSWAFRRGTPVSRPRSR
jgi:uncharacterized protein YndB with AHSA1/START domain